MSLLNTGVLALSWPVLISEKCSILHFFGRCYTSRPFLLTLTIDTTWALLILFPKYLEFPFLVSLTFIVEHFLDIVFNSIIGPSAVLSLMG